MKSILISFVVVVMALALAIPAGGAGKSAGKYSCVQVNRFDVEQGVDFPADYQLGMVEDMVKQVGKVKGVQQVLREGEKAPEGQAVLLITGTVTKFKKGSQAARYIVGFGAGSTVVTAQIKVYDAATKELLLDRKVDGKVVMGVMGGKSEGATNGLAKEVAKVTKEKFF